MNTAKPDISKDDKTIMAEWAKIKDPRLALATLVEHETFLGYDPYYADLRAALIEMAERCSQEPER